MIHYSSNREPDALTRQLFAAHDALRSAQDVAAAKGDAVLSEELMTLIMRTAALIDVSAR